MTTAKILTAAISSKQSTVSRFRVCRMCSLRQEISATHVGTELCRTSVSRHLPWVIAPDSSISISNRNYCCAMAPYWFYTDLQISGCGYCQ
jgi:hypothetical protein